VKAKVKIQFLLFSSFLTLLGCDDSEDVYWGPLDFYGSDIPYDDKNADIHIGMAVVAFVSDHEPEISRNKMSDVILEVVKEKPNTRVIVFPETATSFYWEKGDKDGKKTKENNKQIAEIIPGISTNFIGNITKELNIYVAFGMVEKEDEKIYNSLVMMNPNGEVEAVHRKTFLLDGDKDVGFSAGDGVTFVEIDGVKVALSICHDSDSKSFARDIVNGNAKVVIQALADEKGASLINLDRGYARLWNTWTIYANKAGTEGDFWMENDTLDYAGLVGIIKPTGDIAKKKEYKDGGYIFYNLGIYK